MDFAFEVLLDPFSDKASQKIFGQKKKNQSNFFWLMPCYGFLVSQDSVSSA